MRRGGDADVATGTDKQGPERNMTPIDTWAIAFGCMVGWGAFVMPGTTFLPLAGPAGTAIAMGLGILVMLVIGWNFIYLMNRSSLTGGVYTYTKEAFGRDHAFLAAWFLCLSYLTIVFLNGSALFVVLRTLFNDALQAGYHYTVAGSAIYLSEIAVSVFVVAVIGIFSVAAKPFIQRLHTALSVVLLAGTVLLTVFCLPDALKNGAVDAFGTMGVSRPYAIFSIVVLAPWAFVGFEVTAFDTAHFAFPKKRIRGIVILSILLAGFAYGSMSVVSVAAVPDGYASWGAYFADLDSLGGIASVPTFYAARSVMGRAGLVIAVVSALAAILTGIIGGYRATSRVLSTMAEERILSEKFGSSFWSILFVMLLSILISFLGRNILNWFVDLTALGAIIGFGYTSAAAYKLARAEDRGSVRITGLAGLVISAAFAVVQLVPRMAALEAMGSQAFLTLSLWCLMGFVFYWRTVKVTTLSEYSAMSTSGIALFAMLLYAALMWLGTTLMGRDSAEEMRSTLLTGGAILIAIVFLGLAIMLYMQDLVRRKHELVEREKIRAVEGSLAKSRFLFNMSHDIRTPMNAILGYTKLALEEPSPPQLHGYLEKIDASGRHLLALINDILEMSRIESGQIVLEYAPADLCAMFDELRDLFSGQMREKGIEFRVHTKQVKDRFVWCDKKNLDRVLLNVLSNAYKFTPAGGSISASVWQISGVEEGLGSYEIRIQDSGIGMSREFVDRMFTAFERERTSTDSGVEGTGLGLAITKSIVDLMGGTIEVITSPGSGTEIIIRLKLRLADEADVRKEAELPAPAPAEIDYSTKRLLLVEDNEINMEIAHMILSNIGFMIETAVNGREAVDMVAASEPGYYDAVLMDIQMPVMDGYTAARTIRSLENRELASVPILAMTANAFKEDEQAAAEAGMQAHIAKPIDVDSMLQKLTAVLSGAGKNTAHDNGQN